MKNTAFTSETQSSGGFEPMFPVPRGFPQPYWRRRTWRQKHQEKMFQMDSNMKDGPANCASAPWKKKQTSWRVNSSLIFAGAGGLPPVKMLLRDTSVKKTEVVNQNHISSKVSSGIPCLKDNWKGRMILSRMTKNITKKSQVILPVQLGFKMPCRKLRFCK